MSDSRLSDTDERISRRIELENRKRELEAELEQVNKEIKDLDDLVLKDFEKTGNQRIARHGMTVYVERKLWARPRDGDYQRACHALQEAGLGSYVQERFNVNSVSAFVREAERNGEDLPPQVTDALEISEVYNVRVRRGG